MEKYIYSSYGDYIWQYNHTTNIWTWIKGKNWTIPIVYGQKGISDSSNTPGSSRQGSLTWVRNGKLYLYGGLTYKQFDPTPYYKEDLWTLDTNSFNWTWLAGDSIANKLPVYGVKGYPHYSVWPGPRKSPLVWKGADKLYVFGNSVSEISSDALWEYNHITSYWTWKKGEHNSHSLDYYTFPYVFDELNEPHLRLQALVWQINDTVYMYSGTSAHYNDNIWQYDTERNLWRVIKAPEKKGVVYGKKGIGSYENSPGHKYNACCWQDSRKLYLYGGDGSTTAMWEYDISTNNWRYIKGDTFSAYTVFGIKGISDTLNTPGKRISAQYWTTNGKFYLLGGYGFDKNGAWGLMNDLWEYDPKTNNWRWLTGSNIKEQYGLYGNKGSYSANNTPGARIGSATCVYNNKLYLFGGFAYVTTSTTINDINNNDFWEYDPSVNMWRWLTGDTTTYPLSKYGSKNVLASGNIPGCRSHATMESVNGKIYLLGGNAASSTVCCGMTNEMWMYDPNSGYWAWVNGADTFSERGRYGIKGVYDSANVISAGMLSASWVVKNRLYVLGGTRLLTNVFTGLQLTYNNNALWGCEVCDTLQNCYSTTPSIDLADTTILCNNKTLYLNAGNIGCRYLWSTGDTSQSIGVSIPGICWVKVTNPIGLTTTDTTTVVTGSTPILNLGTDTSICEGEMLLLDAYNKNAKYYWNTGDTSHKINVVSTQRYIVWVVSANMCYGSDSIYVEVKSNPKVPRLGSNSPVCAGDKLVVVDSNSIVGNFKIYGPNSLEIPSNIYTNYNATSLDSGLYYIVDSSNGCISTDTTYVQVFRRFNPIVSITTSPSVNVWPFVMLTFKANVDYDSANTNYKWYQNKNELASETRSTYSAIAYSVVKHNDVICVEIKNPSKCALIDTASDCEQPIIVRLSVDDKLTQEKSIDVSPNPFHDRIDINGTIANAIIELYDVMGRRVYRSIADGNTKSINTGYLANGNYYLKVTHLNADPIVIKIVKE